MNGALYPSPQGAKPIYTWYKKAQIDYIQQYLWLYIAYNAWYREVTGTSNDRQALGILKKRFVIWDDYIQGNTMKPLRAYVERLVELTQREPLTSLSTYWTGSIEGADDWRSLIEFWYQVRCRLVHGSSVNSRYVWLAYETLDIFMGEIVYRMQQCFTKDDSVRMKELDSLLSATRNERFQELQNKLYEKYIASPDIWQVDMQWVKKKPM